MTVLRAWASGAILDMGYVQRTRLIGGALGAMQTYRGRSDAPSSTFSYSACSKDSSVCSARDLDPLGAAWIPVNKPIRKC